MSTYHFLDAQTLLFCYTQNGLWQLAQLNINDGIVKNIDAALTTLSGIYCSDNSAVFIGANASRPNNIYSYTDDTINPLSTLESPLPSSWYSLPKSYKFETSNNEHAHALYYPPRNPKFKCDDQKQPPVIVICHGGPTGATDTSLNFKIQFWTSRGFAVIDVNYRGSTGYGRKFRHSLQENWGIKDVEDVCHAVQYAVEKKWVSANKKIIKGSSAGGFTVLAALTRSTVFNIGTSLYGIGDLEILAKDTHKFEAHYLDTLIGPYPEQKARYIERSPIYHIDKIKSALLLFQGMEDAVVPPNQAAQFFEATKAAGLAVSHITYKNEGHGFRQGTTIEHMLNAELYFYQKLFKLNCKSNEAPIIIENWDEQ